jgi:hypothetical protein
MIVHISQSAQLFTNGKCKLRWGAYGAIACFVAAGAAEIPDMPAEYRAAPSAVIAAAAAASRQIPTQTHSRRKMLFFWFFMCVFSCPKFPAESE